MLQHNVIIWAHSWTWLVRNKLVPLSFLLVKIFWGVLVMGVNGGVRISWGWESGWRFMVLCYNYVFHVFWIFSLLLVQFYMFFFGIVTWVLCLVVVFFNVDKMTTPNPPCKGDHHDIGDHQSQWKGSTPKSWTSK
jgi:hypothetical protein